MSVLAAHVIITSYGFWLPNDPRGSWSEFVASWELLKFGKATKVQTREYVVHACSILPDHCHLIVAPHDRLFERIVAHLKARATQQLRAEGLHPFEERKNDDGSVPSVWATGLWKVYCFDSAHVANAIRYVEENPVREGKKKQAWKFVKPIVP